MDVLLFWVFLPIRFIVSALRALPTVVALVATAWVLAAWGLFWPMLAIVLITVVGSRLIRGGRV